MGSKESTSEANRFDLKFLRDINFWTPYWHFYWAAFLGIILWIPEQWKRVPKGGIKGHSDHFKIFLLAMCTWAGVKQSCCSNFCSEFCQNVIFSLLVRPLCMTHVCHAVEYFYLLFIQPCIFHEMDISLSPSLMSEALWRKKLALKKQLLIKDEPEEFKIQAFLFLDPSCIKVLQLSCGEELKFCNLQWVNVWKLALYPNFLAWTQHQFLTRWKKKDS